MRAWPIFCTAIFQAPETRAGRVMCHTGPSPRRLALVISGSSGSKLPMITALLQKTLESRRESFERLILEIVRAGVTYRQKQRLPIQAEEIEQLNGLLLDVGFKFPELWDPDFHASLRMGSAQRAKERVETALQEERVRATHESRRSAELRELRDRFFVLGSADSRQKAGFELEKILNRLFALHGLAPREPFRVIGEQIDGSFDLDHKTYLVEAKWEREPVCEAPLLVFRGKIEGKSKFTRGVFLSTSGVTHDAREAILRGKQPIFFVVDGYDLTMVLSDEVGLVDFLRQRQRLLAEEGQVVVPFKDLWRESRGNRRSPEGQ